MIHRPQHTLAILPVSIILTLYAFLQCLDVVGWATEKASGV